LDGNITKGAGLFKYNKLLIVGRKVIRKNVCKKFRWGVN